MRYRPAVGLALALLVSTSLVIPTVPAIAGSIEALVPAPASPVTTPGAEPGAVRTWVQLVWNPKTRTLERLSFSAFDPIASQQLDLQWQPDDPADNRAGPLDGRGTLSFRKSGAAAYDAGATVAQYRGMLKAGRADGTGEFLDRSGFSYAGEWRNGLMQGEGRLTTAAGDEYVGAFVDGRRDGEGILTDATGRRYAGHFTAGQPDAEALPAAGDSSVRLGVVAERRPHNYELGFDPLSYTAKSEGEALTILPDDQRLLDVWHGTVPITLTDEEIADFDNSSTTPSFLGAFERFDPLSLVFSLENASTDTVSVVGGYLDVASSDRAPEPAMQVRPYPRNECGGNINYLPKFYLDNFGWTAAAHASLGLTVGTGPSAVPASPLSLGDLTGTYEADVGAQLTALGLDTEIVATTKLHCSDPNDERLCLAELRQSGHFGKLADFLELDYDTVSVPVTGTLDYDWSASDGAARHKTSTFTVDLPVASVASDAECGEGGEIIPLRHDPFVLHLDDKGYKLALPFAADVTPGFTSRWRIELQAPETSTHDFTVVLLLADGQTVTSRPIRLTYFMPSKYVPPTIE